MSRGKARRWDPVPLTLNWCRGPPFGGVSGHRHACPALPGAANACLGLASRGHWGDSPAPELHVQGPERRRSGLSPQPGLSTLPAHW